MRIIPKQNAKLHGLTLVEVMVATGLGSIVLSSAVVMFIYGLFSFAGLGNYSILTGQSRMSLDRMSREIREATQLVDFQNSGRNKYLTFTNAFKGTTIRFSWSQDTGVLLSQVTGQPDRVCLSGCDQWDFNFYQRTPQTNWAFYSTSTLPQTKLINMSWKCSRAILGRNINTENVVTAQVVLRNKS